MTHTDHLGSLGRLTGSKAGLEKRTTARDGQSFRKAEQASRSLTGALAAQRGPDVRMEKVLALQQAIADRTYYVSAAEVADRMVESLLDLAKASR